MSFSKTLRWVGWFISLCTLLVMIGWLTQQESLVRFFNFSTPMLFNTALSLFLLSQALLAFIGGRRQWIVVFAGIVTLLATATLVEHVLSISLGIDTLFVRPFLPSKPHFPGRMGASSAVSLLLLGVAFLCSLRQRFCSFVGVSAALVGGWLGFMSMLSYNFDIDTDFAWGSGFHIALHTALFLALLGFGLPLAVYEREKRSREGFSIPYLALIFLTSATVIITQALIQRDVARAHDLLALKAQSVAETIVSTFQDRHEAFMRMGKRWEQGLYRSEKEWWMDASNYYHDIKGIQSIIWLDPKNIIRWVYPEEGNELLRNRDVSVRPLSVQNIDQAVQSHKVYATAPTELVVGGLGFGIMYPLFYYNNGKYGGILGVAYKYQKMFPEIYRDKAYYLEIYDNDELLYKANSPDAGLYPKWRVSQKFDVLNRHWRLVLSPQAEILRRQVSLVPLLALFFGLLVSTLLGYMLFLYFQTREAEKQIWQASEWQRALTESSHSLIISTDANGVVKTFNRAAEELLEYKADEVIGKATPEIWHERAESPFGFESYVGKARRGVIESGEWNYISKSGKKYRCSLTVSPIRNDQNSITGFVGIIENITDKKIQEAKMASSSRLASLGEMAAGIAHEVNNPLTIIAAQAASVKKTIEGKLGDDENQVLTKLEKIEKTVQRIAKIIRGLRNFAREGSSDERQRVEVAPMIEETLSFCAERFKNAGIDLDVQVTENLFFIGQGLQISQVVLNLLNNAFDALKAAPVKFVKLRAIPVKGGVEISVEDTGPGVPADLREKIMQPFFTTKEVGEGLGLGLSISQGIAVAHHGQLYLDPNSRYTRFVLWIPAA